MDRERLGRVLGKGARMAARTALEAVDAATAAPPNGSSVQAEPASGRVNSPTQPVALAVMLPRNVRPAMAAVRMGALAPLRRASGALWLEVTGSFFALFALSFGVGMWHTRANAFSSVAGDRYRFYTFCVLALLFAYFSVSSFVRARRM